MCFYVYFGNSDQTTDIGEMPEVQPLNQANAAITSICDDEHSYKKRRSKVSSDWRSLETILLNAHISFFNPATHTCIVCNDHVPNIVRCPDCSSSAYFLFNPLGGITLT